MPILHPEVEAAPLGDLRALEERQLRDGLLVHASRSALYRARWREAGIDPGAIHTLQDLQRLPYIRGVDLREVWQHHPHDVLCDPDVRIWFATSGTTGAPKWTPYGRQELAMFEEGVLRVYHMTPTRPPPPAPSCASPRASPRRPHRPRGRRGATNRRCARLPVWWLRGCCASGRGPPNARRSACSTPPPARWASSFSPASPAPSRSCATAPAMSSRCSLSPAAVAAAPTRASACAAGETTW